MIINKRCLVRSSLSIIPGFLDRIKNRKLKVNPLTAQYCYSVWFRHLKLLKDSGLKSFPNVVAEIGPGSSIGVGIAALLSGVKKYYAFDMIKHIDIKRNKEILNGLKVMFLNSYDIPDENIFPTLKPFLNNYKLTPELIYNKEDIEVRFNELVSYFKKDNIQDSTFTNTDIVNYIVPWLNVGSEEISPIDLILSQAVMEHVIELKESYEKMYELLKVGGFMSHQIDFTSHELSNIWYGHRMYSDRMHRFLMQGRSYPINREIYVYHKKILIETGFKIIKEIPYQLQLNHDIESFNKKFQSYSKDDLSIAGMFVICRKQ